MRGMMKHLCVQVGMLFVRCAGGISHSPLESVAEDDIITAVAALHGFLRDTLSDTSSDESPGTARSVHEEL